MSCEHKVNNINGSLCDNGLRCEWLFTAMVNNFCLKKNLRHSHSKSARFTRKNMQNRRIRRPCAGR
jgi:hypothetical protein